ncbi:MAG: hypothetical protein WC707_01015 [Candidatus Babeliaceae bacterium]|jgi:hypothetical protein
MHKLLLIICLATHLCNAQLCTIRYHYKKNNDICTTVTTQDAIQIIKTHLIRRDFNLKQVNEWSLTPKAREHFCKNLTNNGNHAEVTIVAPKKAFGQIEDLIHARYQFDQQKKRY